MLIINLFMLTLTEFIGHFHPVLVHLPIGILLLAALLYWLSRWEKYKPVRPALRIALAAGMISAVLSCISGYILAGTGEYEAGLVSRHQWLGIATAVVAMVAYYFEIRKHRFIQWAIAIMTVLLILTGHFGGTLTHGEGYLTSAFSAGDRGTAAIQRQPIANVQEAVLYTSIIQPLLQEKCNSCHGSTKQKGKLRLDTPEFILLGGKNGKVLVPGKADESNLVKRISLPPANEGHMPPKEKPQLTSNEIELLRWWISSGASFDKKVKELNQPVKIKPVLLALQQRAAMETPALTFIPNTPVETADTGIIQQLKKRGVAIVPIAQNSNYLSANFIAVDSITAEDMQLLAALNKQLIWLKLGNTRCDDSLLATIDQFTALTKLSLERSRITDYSLVRISKLPQLQYLNLSVTAVTAKGLASLSGLKQLRYLYLYQNQVNGDAYAALKQKLPATNIDTGGYAVPVLKSDTTFVKPEK
jgi:uncharacterized membrane protein/mono/diheme cytochrome c family protein